MGADADAGAAVDTGRGELDENTVFLHFTGAAEGTAALGGVKVVDIHAGDGAGRTSRAFFRVTLDAFHCAAAFLTPQRVERKAGKPS